MDPHILVLCTKGGENYRQEVERLIEQEFIVVMVDRHLGD